MQTRLADFIRDSADGREAEAILRACVHCGFCTATCPTYQLLGDELDGPRGRIYLIKQVLEGTEPTELTQLHLDRCLTCRSCETTCPSGVKYGRLVDIGRRVVDEKVGRGTAAAVQRLGLRTVLPNPALFNPLLKLGQAARAVLPPSLGKRIPGGETSLPWPAPRHARRMLVLEGCVQPGLAPNINAATARVLDRLGISLEAEPEAGCCGAVAYHLNDQEGGLEAMRRNVDAWWPCVQAGVEAIVVTASGCGVTVKEYGHLLRDDRAYAERAAKISELARDPSEVVAAEAARLEPLLAPQARGKLAFHSPCTLQHGLKIRGLVEGLLERAGYELTPVPDGHLCCGSAGTYSILQPEISKALLGRKVSALASGGPAQVATANIGCLMHLRGGMALPVRHWIELLDEALGPA